MKIQSRPVSRGPNRANAVEAWDGACFDPFYEEES